MPKTRSNETLVISNKINEYQDLLELIDKLKKNTQIKTLIFKDNPYLQLGKGTSLFHISKSQTIFFRKFVLENTNIIEIKFEGINSFLNKYFTNLTSFRYANLKYLFMVINQGQIQIDNPIRNRCYLDKLDKANFLIILDFLVITPKHSKNLYEVCFGDRKNRMNKFLQADLIEAEPIRLEDFVTSPPKYTVEMETFKLNGVAASHAQDNNYDVLSMSDDEDEVEVDVGMGAGAGAGIDLDLEQQHKADDFGFDDILGSEIDDILNQVEEGETTQGDLEPNEGPMPQAIATIRSFLNTAASKFDTAVKTLETYMPKRD